MNRPSYRLNQPVPIIWRDFLSSAHTPSPLSTNRTSLEGELFLVGGRRLCPLAPRIESSLRCRIPLPSHVPGLETGTADGGAEQVGAVRGRERGEGGR